MSTPLQETIERVCDRLIEEKRWRPFRDREISVVRDGFPIAAYLSLHDRRIHLVFSERYALELGELIKRHGLGMGAEDATEAIVRFLFTHEYNHHHYCPGNAALFEQIMAGIREVVELRELRESTIKQVSFEIANMFSDTVINAIEAHKDQTGTYRLGQDLSLLLALYHTHGRMIGNADKAMRLFLRSHIHLCGMSPGYFDHAKRYLPRRFPEEEQLLREILFVFLRQEQIVSRAYGRELIAQDSQMIIDRMCDYAHWGQEAHDYAMLIHPFLKGEHKYLVNNFTQKKEPGSGTAKTVSRTAANTPGAQRTAPESPNNNQEAPGENGQGDSQDGGPQLSTREARGAIAAEDGQARPAGESALGRDECQSEVENGEQSGEGDPSTVTAPQMRSDAEGVANSDEPFASQEKQKAAAGASLPELLPPLEIPRAVAGATEPQEAQPYPTAQRVVRLRQRSRSRFAGLGSGSLRVIEPDFERLDALYRERAGRITFSDEGDAGDGLIIQTGLEESDLSDLKRLHLPSSAFVRRSDGSSYLLLRERRFPLDILAPVIPSSGEIPDICFVFDSSGSMVFDPEGGSGDYHIAVLTAYSIINGLEQRGIAPLLRYSAMNFSDATFASGWHPYLDLDEVKRAMLRYQGGGTTIDVRKVKAVREERSDRYILFLLSDLEITNIGELEQELVAMHRSRVASVVVFKLGGESISTERLQGEGVNVLFPSKAEEFLYGSLKIAKQVYAAGGA